ncbi:MAG TPA: alpha/beta hydrolase family protein [Alphaproteobacteria bacterium]
MNQSQPRFAGRPEILRPTFENWIATPDPFPAHSDYTVKTVWTRYARNGFEWDIRGTLFIPAVEAMPGVGFTLLHGGAGSEMECVETPDGRPGLAALLAERGYRSLSISFPGHLPLSGEWTDSVETRQPCYLLDQALPDKEIARRNLACTYNTIVQGAAQLADEHMAGYEVVSFGHSTGGPMSISLQRFAKRFKLMGIAGWGSGGPDGWSRERMEMTKKDPDAGSKPIGSVARRTVESFRRSGYEDDLDLTPWGPAERYFDWAFKYKAQFKTCLCDNQHGGSVERLLEYSPITGIDRLEYVDHLLDPAPDFLASTPVLLLAGMSDKGHWISGETEHEKLEPFMARKFAQRTPRTRLVIVPRFGHFGFAGAHNEAIVHCWLEALKSGFFSV